VKWGDIDARRRVRAPGGEAPVAKFSKHSLEHGGDRVRISRIHDLAQTVMADETCECSLRHQSQAGAPEVHDLENLGGVNTIHPDDIVENA